jgi:hypothetical protein
MRLGSFCLIGLSSFIILALLSFASAQTTANPGKGPLRTVADVPPSRCGIRWSPSGLALLSSRVFLATWPGSPMPTRSQWATWQVENYPPSDEERS